MAIVLGTAIGGRMPQGVPSRLASFDNGQAMTVIKRRFEHGDTAVEFEGKSIKMLGAFVTAGLPALALCFCLKSFACAVTEFGTRDRQRNVLAGLAPTMRPWPVALHPVDVVRFA